MKTNGLAFICKRNISGLRLVLGYWRVMWDKYKIVCIMFFQTKKTLLSYLPYNFVFPYFQAKLDYNHHARCGTNPVVKGVPVPETDRHRNQRPACLLPSHSEIPARWWVVRASGEWTGLKSESTGFKPSPLDIHLHWDGSCLPFEKWVAAELKVLQW